MCIITCDRCDRYTNVPPYCVLVKDPTDQCCMKPLCTPPVTQSPHPQNTQSPPGISTLKPPQQGTVSPPLNPQPTQNPPLPTSLLPTPAPREYTHIPSTAFRHLPPNSARFSYATEEALFISALLSTDAVSALSMVWVLI